MAVPTTFAFAFQVRATRIQRVQRHELVKRRLDMASGRVDVTVGRASDDLVFDGKTLTEREAQDLYTEMEAAFATMNDDARIGSRFGTVARSSRPRAAVLPQPKPVAAKTSPVWCGTPSPTP